MTTVLVNGMDLEYEEQGTGVPVVFSHGGGSDLRYWEPQREAFAERYRFVAYSRRYHGAGAWAPDGDYSADAHVADLLAVIRRLGAGSVHLVGFSTALALRAVLREPTAIRTMTVIEPNVQSLLDGDAEGDDALAWWRSENDRVRAEAAGDAERHAELWFELVNNRGRGAFDAEPDEFRRMWLENSTTPRPTPPPPDPLSCDQFRDVTVPTLLIGAEHGTRYSRLIVERLAPCIPNGELIVVPGVTHFMSYQAPQAFNEIVLAFIVGR